MSNLLFRPFLWSLVIFYLTAFASFAQYKGWEPVLNAPDTSNIMPSPYFKVISKEDGVYVFQYPLDLAAAPVVYYAPDGVTFEKKAEIADSARYFTPLFAWKNEIYVSINQIGSTGLMFMKTKDGINYLPIELKYKRKPKVIGVLNDSLYAIVYNIYNANNYRDSIFYDNNGQWTGGYGSPSRTNAINYTTILSQNRLLLQVGTNYQDYYSLKNPPKTYPSTGIQLYPKVWKVGKHLISYKNNFDDYTRPAYLKTNIENGTTVPLSLPQNLVIQYSIDHLVVMPDDTTILLRGYDLSIKKVNYFISRDLGNTWTLIDSIMYPIWETNHLYEEVYTYEGKWFFTNQTLPFWQSTDYGSSWSKVYLQGFRRDTDILAAEGKMLLNTQYFSEDDGQSWITIDKAWNQDSINTIFWRNSLLGWFFTKPASYPFNNIFQVKPHTNTPIDLGYYRNSHKGVLFVQGDYMTLEKQTDFLLFRLNPNNSGYPSTLIKNLTSTFLSDNATCKIFSDGTNLFCYYTTVKDPSGFVQIAVSEDKGLSWRNLSIPTRYTKPFLAASSYDVYDDRHGNLYMTMREFNDPTYGNASLPYIDTARAYKVTKDGLAPVRCEGLEMISHSFYKPLQNLRRYDTGNLYYWIQLKDSLYIVRSNTDGDTWEQIDTKDVPGYAVGMAEDQQGRIYVATQSGLYRQHKLEPDIHVSLGYEYNFGQVFLNSQQSTDIQLSNQGDGNLLFPDDLKITIEGDINDFNVDVTLLTNIIFPQGTISIPVTFKPITEGFKQIKISLYSNDPKNPVYKLLIQGTSTSDGTTATITKKTNSTVLIYPIPATQTLTVKGLEGKVDVEIMSEYGQNIYHGLLSNKVIDVSYLPNGIYLLKLSTDTDVLTRKLIISR